MIKGKTSTGFEYEIKKSKLDNMELIDALVEVESNPLAISRVAKLLLDDEQRHGLYNHLRTPEGNVPIVAVSEAVAEIIKGSGQQGKN